MNSFVEADKEHRQKIELIGKNIGDYLKEAQKIKVNLDDNDISKAIILRMKSYLISQGHIKETLNKRYAAPAADFFVETVLFYCHVVMNSFPKNLEVSSEKAISRRRGSIRPDISIWDGDKVVFAIECKTQLGWNRKGWKQQFEKREKALKDQFKDATLYLLVMTGSNWAGFGEDHRVGEQFFVLLKDIWPLKFDEKDISTICHPIENLFKKMRENLDEI